MYAPQYMPGHYGPTNPPARGDLANLEAMESHSDGFMAVEMWISCVWICENGHVDSISKDMHAFIHN